jgi:rubrerythrin
LDNYDFEYDKDKFDAVWRRVKNEPASAVYKNDKQKTTARDEAGRLRDFMDGEACDAQFYAALSRMGQRSAPQLTQPLQHISGDERTHLKKLRAYYFILTGETYTPPCACPLAYSVPDALRQKYSGEGAAAKAYLEAASSTAHEELSEVYRQLAADEARHRKIIGCLIENIL